MKFQKTETQFYGWKSNDNNKINNFCHWKNLLHFCLRKKRPENAFLILTVNYRKIVQINRICPPKQQINWLFNDIWRYLVIACFDWKLGVFQQAVWRIYYILNEFISHSKVILLFRSLNQSNLTIWKNI